MTREQIEKAAIKFAKSYYLDKYGNMNAKITEDDFDALVCSIAYMFMHGAQWRINSVWHVTFEMPERNRDFLYESAREWFGINNIAKMAKEVHPEDWDRFVEGFDVIRWAYVDDLLPERQEKME